MDSLDEIISSLSSSFGVSENDIHSEHPRFSKYKNEGKVSESQRARRLAHLKKQARARDDCVNRMRGFTKKDQKDIERTDNKMDESVDREKVRKKYKSPFANTLMMSEWLVDIPDIRSFSTEWMMVLSPVGRRTLVVAINGETTAYNKFGSKISKGLSDLPGGNKNSSNSCTMLDCILVRDVSIASKYYVLDLLCWNDRSFANVPFNCRRFFLHSKLKETPEFSNAKSFPLIFLPSCMCTQEAMTELMKTDFCFDLDGLLFYHSEVIYIPEQTPLVGWLKPWMLPEILMVNIPEKYKLGQEEFSTSEEFIKTYNKKHNFKSSIKSTSDVPPDQNSSV